MVETHAPVVVLEVEEELRVEAAGRVDRLPAHQHAAAGQQRHSGHRLVARGIDDVAQLVALEALPEQAAHDARREAPQEEIEHRRIALAEEIGRAVGPRHRGRQRDHVRIRVEPANRVGERVARELDVGIEHQLIIAAGAVQHQVVRDAVADVRVSVQEVELDARIGEALPGEAHAFGRDLLVLAVVDQGHRHLRQDAILSRGADRERKVGETALEQRGIGPVGHDADGQRRREHEEKAFMARGFAAPDLRARGGILGESRRRVNHAGVGARCAATSGQAQPATT